MRKETSETLKKKWEETRQAGIAFSIQVKAALDYFIAFEKEVNEKSKILPVSPQEEKVMKEVNDRLSRGDKSGALKRLDEAFNANIVPSVRYYQIRSSIESVDYSPFVS
jgi:hypothetical protein